LYLLLYSYINIIQGDFESCADILTSGRTPQYVTIEPIMSYKKVDIFPEKEAKSFSKKVRESLKFMKKSVKKKIIVEFFVLFREMNKRDLCHQREDRNLVAQEEILHEI
jgi:hypothetical protein